jgi:hypothetical protein
MEVDLQSARYLWHVARITAAAIYNLIDSTGRASYLASEAGLIEATICHRFKQPLDICAGHAGGSSVHLIAT